MTTLNGNHRSSFFRTGRSASPEISENVGRDMALLDFLELLFLCAAYAIASHPLSST